MDWLLGIDRSRLPEAVTTTLELGTPPRGTAGLLALVGVALVATAALWFLRREGRGRLSRAAAITIGGARLAVILLIALLLAEPRLAVGALEDLEARTIVLVDTSLSMQTRDAYADETRRRAIAAMCGAREEDLSDRSRTQVLEAALAPDAQGRTLLDRLENANEVHLYSYGERPRLLAAPRERDTLAADWASPREDATDLAAAIAAALDDAGGETIAAVIVIGDGRNNTGADPVELARERCARDGIPVHTLLVGDDSPPRNLRVAELLAPDRVFASDPILFEVGIEAAGLGEREVTLELVRSLPDGSEPEVVETRPLRIEGDGRLPPVLLTTTSKTPGEYLYTARVAPLEDETSADDNRQSHTVTVIDDQTRVLLVAGLPSQEYHFLKELLRREGTVNLSVWLQSADRDFPQEGDTPIRELPFTREGLEPYDVVLMLDADPVELSGERIAALRAFVEEDGGGLGFIAGDKHTLPLLTDPACSPLVEMLPVEPEDDQARDYVGFGRHHAAAWRIDPTPEGLDHAITRFAADPHTNRRIWERLSGIHWHLPVARARPGAKVLARHSNPEASSRDGQHPLLVTHFFGPGRTMFLATDETHSWRSVAAKQYARFWIQAIRYLTTGKLLGGTEQLTIVPRDERVHLGGSTEIDVTARSADRTPLEVDSLVARAWPLGGEDKEREITLLPVPGRAGAYTGTLVPWTPGPMRIEIEIETTGGDPTGAAALVQVLPPERELSDTRSDPAALAALATASGGEALGIEAAGALAERIPSRRRRVVRPAPPVELWDSPLTVGLLLALLCVEWIARKRCNLL